MENEAISITADMHERDYLDIIRNVFGSVEVHGNRSINVVFDSMPLFSEALS